MNDDAVDRWSQRHGGLETQSRWVTGWARLTDAIARPLARRVPADVVTGLGVLVVAAAVSVTALGAAWTVLAAVLVVAGAVLDGVDGAVASLRGGGTPWGRVLDPLADRVSDLLLVLALYVAGAPAWPCIGLAVTTVLLEGLRTTAQVVGMDGPGVISVWERPSRVIVAVIGLVVSAALPTQLTWVAWVGLALALLGLAQLLVAVRRALG
ncbi:CDP-alcohol phosphatidyltransferase family protein [Nocardioides marmoraquaticus]